MIELDHAAVLKILPDRDPFAHKGNFGRILLICGSKGYTGAPALAAMGALRTGAGLVYLGVPESIYTVEAIKLTEPIVFPFDDCEIGCLADDATKQLERHVKDKDAVLIGPGLGRSEGVCRCVKKVLMEFDGPVILDADGINVMQAHKNIVRGRTSPTIITPHEGEFMRFTGGHITDRRKAAEKLARDLGCIVALKGHNTIITDGKITYKNSTGNPGMAVGGSGDVLAGMITSLVGQGIAPLEATACSVWLHGAAGDICAAEIGQYGMLPTDMLAVLPRLMK